MKLNPRYGAPKFVLSAKYVGMGAECSTNEMSNAHSSDRKI